MRHYEPPTDLAGSVFDPSDETFGPVMAAIQRGDFEEAAGLLYAAAKPGRRIAVVRYDVTGFTDEEVGTLLMEASVQGERSKPFFPDDPGHPDVAGPVESEVVGQEGRG